MESLCPGTTIFSPKINQNKKTEFDANKNLVSTSNGFARFCFKGLTSEDAEKTECNESMRHLIS